MGLRRRKAEPARGLVPAGANITLVDHDDYEGRIALLADDHAAAVRQVLAERDAALERGESVASIPEVHKYFGLSYANYLVWSRACMQSMPEDWQVRFAQLADELCAAFWHLEEPDYFVLVKGKGGKFIRDPMPHYNRGRTRIPLAGEPGLAVWLAQHPEIDHEHQSRKRWGSDDASAQPA